MFSVYITIYSLNCFLYIYMLYNRCLQLLYRLLDSLAIILFQLIRKQELNCTQYLCMTVLIISYQTNQLVVEWGEGAEGGWQAENFRLGCRKL